MGLMKLIQKALESFGALKKADFDAKVDITLSSHRDALRYWDDYKHSFKHDKSWNISLTVDDYPAHALSMHQGRVLPSDAKVFLKYAWWHPYEDQYDVRQYAYIQSRRIANTYDVVTIVSFQSYPQYVTYGAVERRTMFHIINQLFDELDIYELYAVAGGGTKGLGCLLTVETTKTERVSKAVSAPGYFLLHELGRVHYTYSSADGAEVDLWSIDLGAVYTADTVYVGFWAYIDVAATGSFVKIYTSEDGITWTERYTAGDLPTSKTLFEYVASGISLRYIKATINSAVTTSTAYAGFRRPLVWA
jgi:hypothetical protein